MINYYHLYTIPNPIYCPNKPFVHRQYMLEHLELNYHHKIKKIIDQKSHWPTIPASRVARAGLDSPLWHHGRVQGLTLVSAVAQAPWKQPRGATGKPREGENPWENPGESRLEMSVLWWSTMLCPAVKCVNWFSWFSFTPTSTSSINPTAISTDVSQLFPCHPLLPYLGGFTLRKHSATSPGITFWHPLASSGIRRPGLQSPRCIAASGVLVQVFWTSKWRCSIAMVLMTPGSTFHVQSFFDWWGYGFLITFLTFQKQISAECRVSKVGHGWPISG